MTADEILDRIDAGAQVPEEVHVLAKELLAAWQAQAAQDAALLEAQQLKVERDHMRDLSRVLQGQLDVAVKKLEDMPARLYRQQGEQAIATALSQGEDLPGYHPELAFQIRKNRNDLYARVAELEAQLKATSEYAEKVFANGVDSAVECDVLRKQLDDLTAQLKAKSEYAEKVRVWGEQTRGLLDTKSAQCQSLWDSAMRVQEERDRLLKTVKDLEKKLKAKPPEASKALAAHLGRELDAVEAKNRQLVESFKRVQRDLYAAKAKVAAADEVVAVAAKAKDPATLREAVHHYSKVVVLHRSPTS